MAAGKQGPEPSQGLIRSHAWRRYLVQAEREKVFPAKEIREYLEDPEGHPDHWRLLFTTPPGAPTALMAIAWQSCCYLGQEEHDGSQYGACTCEALIPGTLGVDWTEQEFWQLAGHLKFEDRPAPRWQ
jgi:hypothetical protein